MRKKPASIIIWDLDVFIRTGLSYFTNGASKTDLDCWIVLYFCGTVYLLFSDVSFLNPWPMGVVFFIGEWLGGIILHFDD